MRRGFSIKGFYFQKDTVSQKTHPNTDIIGEDLMIDGYKWKSNESKSCNLNSLKNYLHIIYFDFLK
jgi:hypothetical protein